MTNDTLHDGLPEVLGILNLANGGAQELVDDALKQLAANIADPNTEPTQKRSITLKIEASPFKDRSGAEVKVKVEQKFAGKQSVDTTMYVAKKDGEYLAFGRNTKQTEIEWSETRDHSGPDNPKPAGPRKVN